MDHVLLACFIPSLSPDVFDFVFSSYLKKRSEAVNYVQPRSYNHPILVEERMASHVLPEVRRMYPTIIAIIVLSTPGVTKQSNGGNTK